MKALPLILTFALLGVNTPFRALPEEPQMPEKPESIVENAAEWDAMFSAAAMENVTMTTHTEMTGENGTVSDSILRQDGNRLQMVDPGIPLLSWEQYYPEEGLVLRCIAEENGYFFTCMEESAENRESTGSFLLSGQYAGRFDEAVYNAAEACYDLVSALGCDRIYAENGRLVKIVSLLGDEYTSVSEFTDYGATVVEPMPVVVSAADVRAWDNVSFSESVTPPEARND